METRTLIFAGKTILLDNEGFLLDPEDWSNELAVELARQLGLTLNQERQTVVTFIREYYEENMTVPETRKLLKHLQQVWGKERATRKYLYKLFPYGYGQQACKIAGMRKPLKLILDV